MLRELSINKTFITAVQKPGDW